MAEALTVFRDTAIEIEENNLREIAMTRRRLVDSPKGTGTGFVWNETGHIVTNFHVIEGGNNFEVGAIEGDYVSEGPPPLKDDGESGSSSSGAGPEFL